MALSFDDVRDLTEAVRIARDGSAKALRQRLGVGVAAIGDACGVTGSTVTRWENGVRVPKGAAAISWVRLMRHLTEAEEDLK